MATFPTYACVLWPDGDETPDPIVVRSAMDRGVAKQRRTQTDTMISKTISVLFRSVADAESFKDWFYAEDGANAGAGWFDFTIPRTGVVVQARVIGGELGALQMMVHQGVYRRSLPIEWKDVLA